MSDLCKYINGISTKGSTEMTKLSVFVSLSAAVVFHKLFHWHKERYQSNSYKDDSIWKTICSGLGLYNMQREQMTTLYQQLQVLEGWVLCLGVHANTYLAQQCPGDKLTTVTLSPFTWPKKEGLPLFFRKKQQIFAELL